ncbi:Maintenance of telomere capping protein 6 [Ciborinia camelliae]|nr:Maintenance of telomere capping protein 6 [Ciborinia camelliae]
MSESYKPSTDALPESPYDIAFLSQRDLGLNIPINYATAPGVSLTAACFPFLKYEDDDSADCISNLLADGFRRLEVDLYWDQMRQLWSFCPVAIPVSASSIVSSPTPTSTLPSTTASLTSAQQTTDLIARQDAGTSEIIPSSSMSDSSTSPTSSPSPHTWSAVNLIESSLESTLPATSEIPNSSTKPLYNTGPYTCTTTINLYILTNLLLDYIQKTQNTIDAYMLIMTLNIHAVKSDFNVNGPAPQPLSFPDAPNSLGSLFSANLSAYIYTPNDLKSNRANLNTSWYSVTERYRPVQDYYTTIAEEFEVITTEDGWPSEAYIEFSQGKRMLLQFGSVDPQMTKYNFNGDEGTIFFPGYINNPRENDILASSDGILNSGCFLVNATEQVSQVNSSWATAANIPGFDYPTHANSSLASLLSLTSSLTSCGISPTLNTTLLNTTASSNNLPYKNYTHSSIWSWAPNEPRNFSSSIDNSASHFRCATLRSATNHWHVTDCSNKLYAACRAPSQPYNWTLTTYAISYSYAPLACPTPYTFSAPRTALENAYLIQTIKNLSPSRDFDTTDSRVWLDFNSLDMRNCWTTGGPNATCPYSGQALSGNTVEKEILVPTIAAFLVLILTGLVVFGKCAGRGWASRRSGGKRRRRRDAGVVYEGVPA